uniref:DNA topoisomerase 2 n=1 Tax=Ochrobactrum phage ORM_20 TaxID=2985243 RepID=A0A9N6WWN2_9VIRU|nr:DNA topoisomerase II large subunit [Ochrobactrum phage ORM_20]
MSEEIVELNDVQHARIRTEMYLGSRVPQEFVFPVVTINGSIGFKEFKIVPAVLTAFREALDNALDEMSFVGKGKIDVEYEEETSKFTVTDSGRGIPIDWRESSNMHTATLAVSRAKAGRNFGERSEVAGTNGLGISIVNFVSSQFHLHVKRDKTSFAQFFYSTEEGLETGEPEIRDYTNKDTGTSVSFYLDPEVFKEGLDLPTELVESMIILIATSNRHIKFTFNGQSVQPLNSLEKHGIVIPFSKEGVGSGKFIVKRREGDPYSFTFVNNVPAYNGGTHLDEFRNHFPKHLLEALKKESKKRRLNPSKSDVLDSIDIIGFVKMNGPNFDSQSKTRLTNSEIRNPIYHSFNDVDWAKEIAKNKDIVEAIYELCAQRTGQKDKSQVDQNAKALKKAKIAKLVDANSRFRDQCVLFLAEGDSAAGGMSSVRDPNLHAMLPLRGKIKNVHGLSAKDAIGDKESVIKDICAAIGLVPGKKADRKELRYSKVYLMADADEDGQGSICPLLVNFFYRFWPELFRDKPFIHIFMTPLIILTKGKDRKYFYPTNMDEFDPKQWKGWDIKRAKGLGSMMPINFKDHIDNPLAIGCMEDDIGTLGKLMSLLFQDGRSDDRKTMMEITVDDVISRLETMGQDWSATGVNDLDIS